MGSIIRVVKDTARDLTKGVGNVIETVVEKPIKKIGKEGFDTLAGTTDEERRAMLSGDINFPEVTPEVTPIATPVTPVAPVVPATTSFKDFISDEGGIDANYLGRYKEYDPDVDEEALKKFLDSNGNDLNKVMKAVVTKKRLSRGRTLRLEDLCLKRTAFSSSDCLIYRTDEVVGRTLTVDVDINRAITGTMLA